MMNLMPFSVSVKVLLQSILILWRIITMTNDTQKSSSYVTTRNRRETYQTDTLSESVNPLFLFSWGNRGPGSIVIFIWKKNKYFFLASESTPEFWYSFVSLRGDGHRVTVRSYTVPLIWGCANEDFFTMSRRMSTLEFRACLQRVVVKGHHITVAATLSWILWSVSQFVGQR